MARLTVVPLRDRFDELYRSFDYAESATDPVHLVRRFADAADREVVAFCAAALAFEIGRAHV